MTLEAIPSSGKTFPVLLRIDNFQRVRRSVQHDLDQPIIQSQRRGNFPGHRGIRFRRVASEPWNVVRDMVPGGKKIRNDGNASSPPIHTTREGGSKVRLGEFHVRESNDDIGATMLNSIRKSLDQAVRLIEPAPVIDQNESRLFAASVHRIR